MASAVSAVPSEAQESSWEGSSFARPARRIRWVLFGAMSLLGAASIATATINSIAGADLGGVIPLTLAIAWRRMAAATA